MFHYILLSAEKTNGTNVKLYMEMDTEILP